MPDEGRFPELARSLRSLGAARDPASQAAHDAIFGPLIDARVRAANASEREVFGIFRGIILADLIERGVVDAAVAGIEPAALARARAASARDLLEPVRAALAALDDRATPASVAGLGTTEWNAWLTQLRRSFGAADDACSHLARLLAAPTRATEPTGWFGSRKR
ncbi:MAG: hypothetical protein ABIP93_07215 [Gemmatimonadaceae bacterium]